MGSVQSEESFAILPLAMDDGDAGCSSWIKFCCDTSCLDWSASCKAGSLLYKDSACVTVLDCNAKQTDNMKLKTHQTPHSSVLSNTTQLQLLAASDSTHDFAGLIVAISC